MSKVELIGPRDVLLNVLETVRASEILQIDPAIQQRMEHGAEAHLRPLALAGKTLAERLFYEDLDLKITRLLTLLPAVPTKETPVSAPRALSAIAGVIGERIALCEEKTRRREAVQTEMRQLSRYTIFLTTVESLVPKGAEEAGLDVIAVEVRDQSALDRLTKVAGRLLLGADVRTARSEDGSYIGLLTTEKQLSDTLKEALRNDAIPEVSLPPYLEGLTLAGKISTVRDRYESLSAESATIDTELRGYAETWRPLYEDVHSWLKGQLALLKTSSLAYGTDNCFVLFGWVPTAEVARLRNLVNKQFGDTVIIEEKEILEHDLETVPVTLKNPAYFQPFELLVRLLPLPRYTSIDPTPFIGIFFPLFFGMILGDVGYGLVLLLVALGLAFRAKQELLQHVGKILFTCSIYSALFGFLYGELFGDLGTRMFGMKAWIDRTTSLMPMMYFAIAVGTVHVLLGLILGVFTALRGKRRKEAGFRLASVVLVLCIAGILVSYFAPVGALLRRPLMIAMLIIAPVLLLTGGFLAPFELLKSLGNIISYVRIMAVGLASVLLAYVANSLAGAAGSIWIGIVVAVILHAFNIVLGVFAPTIHALRLHYVEFFGKFFEPGGKPYMPLKKAH
ncbi:MAG TPA: V-type ATPase 116kDa subunit family protein [Thermoanaerobaculia bacterium]|nr:V-type ATPase 116kDa subunit family protein [Thermoanaerobaculia bacterium]